MQGAPQCPNSASRAVLTASFPGSPLLSMAENAPSPEERPRARWPLILGGLVGGFLLLAAGLALGWYLFYRPIVNVAVQLPAPPAPGAGQGAGRADREAEGRQQADRGPDRAPEGAAEGRCLHHQGSLGQGARLARAG